MALLLLNQLGEGALAQVDTGVYHSAAYNSLTVASGCSPSEYASTLFNPSYAVGAIDATDYDVPVLAEFAQIGGEAALSALSLTNVQPLHSMAFQALVPADAIASTFDDAFAADSRLVNAEEVSNGAKMSAAFLGVQTGDAALANVNQTRQIVAEIVDGTSAPGLDSILSHLDSGCPTNGANACANYTIPACFGTVNADLAATSNATATEVTSSRVAYAFHLETAPADIVYFGSLIANEPNVLFVEPTIASEPLSTDPLAELGIPRGDAPEVAQGFGVSGACEYMYDRDYDGTGELVGIFDDGVQADDLFFSYPSGASSPCFNAATDSGCCAFDAADGCTSFSSSCTDPSVTCSAVADPHLGGAAVNTNDEARTVVAYIPYADNRPATHGTKVASTAVGYLYESRSVTCDVEGADDVRGVASGAKTVFVDVGVDGSQELHVPTTAFGSALQEFSYNLGANTVLLAWGSDNSGASDAITRDIDAFVSANSDAVVVAATGTGSANVNTAQAKNAISVGVYGASSTLTPDLSVQLITPLHANVDANELDASEFCDIDTFEGSSAAASIVAGQVAVVEQYLKALGTIYEYPEGGNESVVDGSSYTGASLKALLVASASNGGDHDGNGAGVPVLSRALPFEEEHQFDLRIEQHSFATEGVSASRTINVEDSGRALVVALAYSDAAPSAFAASGTGVVNDLRLTVRTPSTTYSSGVVVYPNGAVDGSAPANNMQKVIIPEPDLGEYVITVTSAFLSETSVSDQAASLVVTGRFSVDSTDSVTGQEAGEITSTPACCPYGTLYPTTSCFPITFLVLIIIVVLAAGLVLICVFRSKCKAKDVESAK